jgi:hypothetical protein
MCARPWAEESLVRVERDNLARMGALYQVCARFRVWVQDLGFRDNLARMGALYQVCARCRVRV